MKNGGKKVPFRIVLLPLFLVSALWVLLARPQIPLGTGSVELERKAHPDFLRAHVEKLSIDLTSRDSDHPENLNKAAAYIQKSFAASGARVSEQVYTFG